MYSCNTLICISQQEQKCELKMNRDYSFVTACKASGIPWLLNNYALCVSLHDVATPGSIQNNNNSLKKNLYKYTYIIITKRRNNNKTKKRKKMNETKKNRKQKENDSMYRKWRLERRNTTVYVLMMMHGGLRMSHNTLIYEAHESTM